MNHPDQAGLGPYRTSSYTEPPKTKVQRPSWWRRLRCWFGRHGAEHYADPFCGHADHRHIQDFRYACCGKQVYSRVILQLGHSFERDYPTQDHPFITRHRCWFCVDRDDPRCYNRRSK